MSDPYRISETPAPEQAAANSGARRGLLRPVLWVVLILAAAVNAVTSSAGLNPFVAGTFGLITLASATALIVHHYRHRRG